MNFPDCAYKSLKKLANQRQFSRLTLVEGGGGTTSGGGGGGEYDYADVLGKSILFYEAQRSGFYEVNMSLAEQGVDVLVFWYTSITLLVYWYNGPFSSFLVCCSCY